MTDLEMYLQFRKEIDTLMYPILIPYCTYETISNDKGKKIGFVIAEGEYIDSFWIAPEYRNKGYGSKLLKNYMGKNGMPETLRILHNNYPAKAFWNSHFYLKTEETNIIDSLYRIIDAKSK